MPTPDTTSHYLNNPPLTTREKELLAALADATDSVLGPQGGFSALGMERTEEILLLLLRHRKPVRAHRRTWRIDIPAELQSAVYAAGGQTRAEWLTSPEGRAITESARIRAAELGK